MISATTKPSSATSATISTTRKTRGRWNLPSAKSQRPTIFSSEENSNNVANNSTSENDTVSDSETVQPAATPRTAKSTIKSLQMPVSAQSGSVSSSGALTDRTNNVNNKRNSMALNSASSTAANKKPKSESGSFTARLVNVSAKINTGRANIMGSIRTSAIGRKSMAGNTPSKALLNTSMNSSIDSDSSINTSTMSSNTSIDSSSVSALETELQAQLALKSQLEAKINELESASQQQQSELSATRTELSVSQADNSTKSQLIESQSTTIDQLKSELAELKAQLMAEQGVNQQKSAQISEYLTQIAAHQAEISSLHSEARQAEALRKDLHNQIMELKGNIRVFIRLRPALGPGASEESVYEFPTNAAENKSITINSGSVSSLDGRSEGKKSNSFQFDRVFKPHQSQGEVFTEIAQLVQSSLDGYKVCIFAYGQTGSGKTHTMMGGSSPDTRGMIPRAVDQIFAAIQANAAQGWQYEVSMQCIEIYNESLRDLLATSTNGPKPEIKLLKPNESSKLLQAVPTVTNINTMPVSSPANVFPLLSKANQARSVAATDCNDQSSRSHSVFQFKINGHNSLTQQSTQGVLSLIDLAGSERLNKSNATGDRAKETVHINKSLSALADVIHSLNRGEGHIPYRNSTLTHLLQPCLAPNGESKTLFFINLSPEQESVSESLCSLRFAAKVNACQIGTARRNIKNQ